MPDLGSTDLKNGPRLPFRAPRQDQDGPTGVRVRVVRIGDPSGGARVGRARVFERRPSLNLKLINQN